MERKKGRVSWRVFLLPRTHTANPAGHANTEDEQRRNRTVMTNRAKPSSAISEEREPFLPAFLPLSTWLNSARLSLDGWTAFYIVV